MEKFEQMFCKSCGLASPNSLNDIKITAFYSDEK